MVLFVCIVAVLVIISQSSAYAENEWKITTMTSGNQSFKIPYKITNGTLQSMKLIKDGLFEINISNVANNGMIQSSIPLDLVGLGEQWGGFAEVDVNGKKINNPKYNYSPCFTTVNIAFDSKSDSKRIDILSTAIPEGPFSLPVSPIYANATENSKILTLSGCTDLKLNDNKLIINIINSEKQHNATLSVVPDINGSFSTSFPLENHLDTNRTHIILTYAGYSTTTSVIPEFPQMGILVFATAISSIMVARFLAKI
jgi:hypothetical protein